MTFKQLPTLAALVLLLGVAPGAVAHVTTVTIIMNEQGFEPRAVTVDENATIIFQNKDTIDRWPASNVHPTHYIYPEFNPTKPIPPGELWIFRPAKLGRWKYHDHLRPHRRGTITVVAEQGEEKDQALEENNTPPQAAPGAQTGTPNSFWSRATITARRVWQSIIDLFERAQRAPTAPANFPSLAEEEQFAYVRSLKETAGLPEAWEFVKTTFSNDSGASRGGRAHDLAHFVGQMVFEDKGIGGLAVCDSTYAFGCYHGFTEAAFSENLDMLPVVAQACQSLGAPPSGPWASCIHGIGHGVATYFDAVELANALTTCDRLEAGATYCHDGVFMEFSFSAPPAFYQSEDPLYPCSAVDATYRPACGRNQPNIMKTRLDMSQRDTAKICAEAEPAISEGCIDSLGFSIAHESQGNPQTILGSCGVFSEAAHQAQCAAAAAGELVFQNSPNWQQNSQFVCQGLPQAHQQACFNRVQQTADNYQR